MATKLDCVEVVLHNLTHHVFCVSSGNEVTDNTTVRANMSVASSPSNLLLSPQVSNIICELVNITRAQINNNLCVVFALK